MVSVLHLSLIGFLLFFVAIIQAKSSLETSNDVKENKSPISNKQLYELYKMIRADPRYESVSNKDIVSYIYRNVVLGNGDDIDFIKSKYQQRPPHYQQDAVQVE
jgi:hypothetical protein